MAAYNPASIEPKWQKFWLEHNTFATESISTKPKYYVLDMFPYPSGEGLHVGHPEGYTATDIVARYKRARGFNVMHPMGWDAFGLPAEQYAIKTDTHPSVVTRKNIQRFRSQLQAIGFSYDWQRQVDTTDPGYYRWTQWIFTLLHDTWFDDRQNRGRPISELIEEFSSGRRQPADGVQWKALSDADRRRILEKYRLAYQLEAPVNWCPALGTVLANEEVIDGKSEVGGFPVERRPMRQWMLRITAYARRLLDGLAALEWSESLKLMQRNWIGESQGARVRFAVAGEHLEVFTTRPDTLFGVTYMVLAPEHPLVNLSGPDVKIPAAWPAGTPETWRGQNPAPTPRAAIAAYQLATAARSERQRQEDTRKTGVFTGLYAVNPVNGDSIPVFISDYVLAGYGTGAIMAVPAHDERDFEFAQLFGLPIRPVVRPADGAEPKLPLTEGGIAFNSPWIDGLATDEAKNKICEILESKGIGSREVTYRIRDWLFSRQRYWGEPFPIVHLPDGTTVALADDELPLRLPEMTDFKPTQTMEPPLSKAGAWCHVHVQLIGPAENPRARVVPPGTAGAVVARRELNTMPQWAGSCWYYLRYLDPHNTRALCDPAVEKYWMSSPAGVDMYVGGAEHAVLHLLYARFWHQVLFDRGLVSSPEPFRKLINQGLILGEAEYTLFRDAAGKPVSMDDVDPEWTSRPGSDGKVQFLSRRRSDGAEVYASPVEPDQVERRGDVAVLKTEPEIRVDARSFKMSKSRGNVVNPDDVIRDYGADSLRLFEMFMGPLEQVKPWSMAGVEGVYRFLGRVWRHLAGAADFPSRIVEHRSGRYYLRGQPLNEEQSRAALAERESLLRPLHRTIRKVTQDIERLSFNTAISAMMEFNNLLGKPETLDRDQMLTFVRLLEPFAPHMAEELHQILTGAARSLTELPWPEYDESLCADDTVDLPVQINGKLAGRVMIDAGWADGEVLARVLADERIQSRLAGRPMKKHIYVKGRMLNLVVQG